LNYGRGRAEQFRLHPTLGSALNFVPPLFCLYLLTIPFLPVWGLVPLSLYVLAVLAQTVAVATRSNLWCGARVLPLIALTNVLYGLGFWHGLFTRLAPPKPPPPGDIRLEIVPPSPTPTC